MRMPIRQETALFYDASAARNSQADGARAADGVLLFLTLKIFTLTACPLLFSPDFSNNFHFIINQPLNFKQTISA